MAVAGLHDQPVLPHWRTVLEQRLTAIGMGPIEHRPPEPTVRDRCSTASAWPAPGAARRAEAVAEAAYGGRLSLAGLRVMRAGRLPPVRRRPSDEEQ